MSRFERQKQARQRDAEHGLVTRVLRLRLKDKHAPYLRGLAAQVNLAWNFCNETSRRVLERERNFLLTQQKRRPRWAGATVGLPFFVQRGDNR